MDAALIFHAGISALSADHETDRLHASDPDLFKIQDLRSPSASLRVVYIHSVYFSGKQGGFVPARACADLHDDVLVIVGILGKKQYFDPVFQFPDPLSGLGELFLGQIAHLLVSLLLEHLQGLISCLPALAVFTICLYKRRQVALFLH